MGELHGSAQSALSAAAGWRRHVKLVQVNQYGRLHFAQKDVSAANVTIDLTVPPVKWQLKMTNDNPTTADGNLENDPAEVEECSCC